MLQSLRSRRNRKGFTLAELLIVVAIIAVLVAIAVPLFMGALNDAKKSVAEANCRAVRGAAVEEILMNTQRTDGSQLDYGNGPWFVTATVDASGEISKIVIKTDAAQEFTDGYTKVGVSGSEKAAYQRQADGSYKVEVKITELVGAVS